jgi:hypothetical protein
MDLWKGTLVLDEFNLEEKDDDTKEIIKILNQGFEKGRAVPRCDPDNQNQVLAFDPYGPKIFASQKEYKSLAFESRCLKEILQPSTTKPVNLTKEFFKERLNLQNKLLKYRFDTIDTIDASIINKINFGSIQPRIRQAYGPLMLMYPLEHVMNTEIMLMMQERSDQIKEENTGTFAGMVFNSYLRLQNEGHQVITSTLICQDCNTVLHDDKKLTPAYVGKLLSGAGFKIKPTTIEGKSVRLVTLDDKIREKLLQRFNVTS